MLTSLARMEATPGGHNGRPLTDQLQSPGADGIGPGWTPDPSRGQKLKCRSVVSCKPDYAYHYDHLAVQKEAMKKMPIVTVREEQLLGRQHALESRQSSRSGSSMRGGGYAGEVGATRMKEKGGKATSGSALKKKEKDDQQRKEETSPVKVPEDEGLLSREGGGDGVEASPEQASTTVLADHEPDVRAAGGQKKIPSQNRRSTLMDPTGACGAGRRERRRRSVAGKLDLGAGGGLAGLAKRSQNTNASSLPRLWNPDGEAESSRKNKDDGEEVGPDVMDHTPRGLGRQTRRMLSRLREAIDGDQEEKEFSNFFGKRDDEAGDGAKQALMRPFQGPEPQKPGMGLAAQLGGLGSQNNYRSDLFREFKNNENTGPKVGCWNRTGDFELGLGFEKLRQRTGIFKTAMQHMPGSELAELRHLHSSTVRRTKKLALPRK